MTTLQICNYALVLIGQSKKITSLDDNTAHATVCASVYDIARQTVLAEHPWNFAVKQAALTEVTDETSAEDYSFVYEYPSDCLRVLRIFYGATTAGTVNKYKVIYTKDGTVFVKRIVCDLDDAYAEYILDLQEEALFTPAFCEALAAKIASLAAMPLTQDAKIVQAMQQTYAGMLAHAKYMSAIEQLQDVNKPNRYLDAR
jgi:hypothetical protein